MGLGAVLFLAIPLFESSAALAPAPPQSDLLKQDLVGFLEGGRKTTALVPSHPLYALRSYPLTATAAFLLMENDPALLAKLYPEISKSVMQLFAEDNLAGQGLVRGMPNSAEERNSCLSPGFNVLADLELYSLHLIAWKTGAYEDALEFLAWSNRLSDLITRSFYDPSRRLFYPIDGNGNLVASHSPSQLLPLVADMTLGSSAHERIARAYLEEGAGPDLAKPKTPDELDPWEEPFMRFTILDLLSTTLDRQGELFAALHASTRETAPAGNSGQAVWSAFWRDEPSLTRHLFPRWKVVSSLVNLTLLFERESLLQTKELSGLRAGIDSLIAALSTQSMTLEAYVEATGTANKLLAEVSRISQLIDSKGERWRIIDEGKWLRLSPRIKRLVTDGCASSLVELVRAKSELSLQLERDCGIVFRLNVPPRPVVAGKPVEFAATLQVLRDTLTASQFYVQIGDTRWKIMETEQAVTLVPGGGQLRYENVLPAPRTDEPGIVTLHSFIDFLAGGRLIEIHRDESVVLAKEYDAAFDLPEGRRIQERPLPMEIILTYRPEHDVQGKVDGTFLREFTSTPPLPASFIVHKDSERTRLVLMVSPKGTLSPGRYPFSLTVAVGGNPVALFEETLVRPFRWLHIGPLMRPDEALKNGLEFQTDIFKTHTVSDGRALRWQEVSPDAIDSEGALWPQRLYGKTADRCMLLYTVVDAPSRMKLVWKLASKNAISLWVNSSLLVAGGDVRSDEMSGPLELRKGTNSFLIAACWKEAPGSISFEMRDENDLPPTGLNNDLNAIIDGYERLAANETGAKKETPPEEQLREVVVSYQNPDATEVAVIGSFNNWEPGATQMKRTGKGTWTASLALRPGKYPYKLLVNRKSKITDPASKETEPDGFGGVNSVLEVR